MPWDSNLPKETDETTNLDCRAHDYSYFCLVLDCYCGWVALRSRRPCRASPRRLAPPTTAMHLSQCNLPAAMVTSWPIATTHLHRVRLRCKARWCWCMSRAPPARACTRWPTLWQRPAIACIRSTFVVTGLQGPKDTSTTWVSLRMI